jgi:hypothetical protein
MSETNHKGLALGHEMAELAGDHAGDYWLNLAIDAIRRYARNKQQFTTEQVRNANPDLPDPPDKRAWGAAIRKAKKEGFIEPAGWVRAESLTVHGMVVTLWRSKIYKGYTYA